jgi:hypothetical protein
VTQLKLNRVPAACLIIIFFIALLPLKSRSQEIIDAPPAKLITRFPFTMLSGGIIIIEAKLDDYIDTLNFILDTGSGGISLDSSTVEYFKLPTVKSDKTIRGIGGVKNVEFTTDHTLKLPNLETANLDFHINDYSLLTSVYGMRIDGIIGYSFLRRYIVCLNYDRSEISVYSPGSFRYPKSGTLLKPSFNSLPMQPVLVRDDKTVVNKFYFDTGAGLCFLLSEDFARDSAILPKNKKMLLTQAEGLGGKRPMYLTVVKEVRIGPYKFRKVPTYVFNDEFNVTSYPNTGGLLGNDLLRRFNVILNYPEQSIHLQPNSHYGESFDYSYTGLGIYSEEGEVIVLDVIKDSPGEKAGFKVGDLIYRNLLQNAGSNIKVLVMRDGKPFLLNLNVRHILSKN